MATTKGFEVIEVSEVEAGRRGRKFVPDARLLAAMEQLRDTGKGVKLSFLGSVDGPQRPNVRNKITRHWQEVAGEDAPAVSIIWTPNTSATPGVAQVILAKPKASKAS